ncbi:MAG TPA: phosphoribosyltransferase [Peptococcaceae bacterium]|nr:phosphoribosyltransferase [Peptococcaceae bacterium]
MFADRVDAGRRLAERLKAEGVRPDLVLAIPRGGVVIGAQVARALGVPLDVIVPRKIGAPHNPEYAVGAVTEDGTFIYDEQALHALGLEPADLSGEVERQVREIARRTRLYRRDAPYPSLTGKSIVLTDDGIATGLTTLAALRSLKKAKPREVILAVPVASAEALAGLRQEVDRVVCLLVPELFFAVGQFYREFAQTTDEEVIALLS